VEDGHEHHVFKHTPLSHPLAQQPLPFHPELFQHPTRRWISDHVVGVNAIELQLLKGKADYPPRRLMAPMKDFFNGQPKSGKLPDGCWSALRKLQETLYEYDEKSKLTKDGRTVHYSDNFRLREWSREQIALTIEAAGFRKEGELSDKFPGLGEVYLLFSRNSSEEKRPAVEPHCA
jgi:hypothetical protein